MTFWQSITHTVVSAIVLWATLFSAALLAVGQADLARLDRLDGSYNGEVVSLPRWRQAIFELRQSASLDAMWPDARELQESQLARMPRQAIPLALLHTSYTHAADASTHEAFAVTPLRMVNYFPENTQFVLSRDAVLTAGDVPKISSLYFDAGDGLGYRPMAWDNPLRVSYPQGGIYTLRLRALLEDGTTCYSASQLNVVDGPGPPPPDDTWVVTATEPWMGATASGQAYLYLAEGNTQVTRPVVVIEGFDIDNSIDWPVLYELLNREQLLEDLRSMGYDTVVLDFTEAVEPIQRNAFVFTRLIEMIQGEVGPDRNIALVGASMGGLVGRYGLLWMEDQGIDHRVTSFISFDSPHGGANMPLGLQHWLAFFADQAEEAAFLLERLNSDAARQMLLYHVSSTSGSNAAPDPLLDAFNADLASLGNWPLSPRLSSVINGSGNMADQGFNAGDQIVEWNYSSLPVDIVGDAWSVPDGGSQVIFDGLIDIILLPPETETVTIAGTLPWDNSPGGSRPTMDQLAEPTAPYGDIIALHGSHSFVPSVSAIALDTADPFYDIAGDPALNANVPFDQVYFPDSNQEHILVTPENKAWFIFEIGQGLPAEIIIRNSFE